MKKVMAALLLSTFVIGPALAETSAPVKKKAAATAPAVLEAGDYSATVKALVCDGCGAYIKATMEKQKGLDQVMVDQKSKTVTFHVQQGTSVKVADLQKALKDAADQMGMGADYTLQGLKPAAKKA